ncbi:MAG: class I tRNA ligase family protein, partial [Fibrobacteres bacterium]|nr:class I tRNA ligase family protein [Fibrobacterota bacterium]
NEFLNLEGQKVSTSRNFAIWVHDAVKDFGADTLRWYTASIAPETKDSDFSLKELQATSNGELADILGNFVNRTATFADKYFNGEVPALSITDNESTAMLARITEVQTLLDEAYSKFQLRKACGIIMDFCRDANKYFNDQAPWKSRKESMDKCGSTIHVCLKLIRALSVFTLPLIPFAAAKLAAILPEDNRAAWNSVNSELKAGIKISTPPILFTKIEEEKIEECRARLGAPQ